MSPILRSFGARLRSWGVAPLLCALLGALPVTAAIEVGHSFPDLGRYPLEGAVPARAGRVVLVDFWASWCTPCKASFPALAALHRELEPRGLTIIAASVDEKAAPYAAFVKKLQPPFATVRDTAQKLVADVKVPAMPTSYLIDRRGVVRFVHAGYHGESTDRALRAQIIQLLEEKP